MRFLPGVGPKGVVVGRAGQQLVERVFDVGPDVEVVANRTADEREEVGCPLARRHAADEEPVLPVMQSSA